MKTSQAGLEFIAHWEGEVLHTYDDGVGVMTIGIGHALLPGEHYPNGITHQQALGLLAHDIRIAERGVAELGVELAQHEFDALVSFAFNVGTGGLAGSTVAREIKMGHRKAAADALLLWDKAGGKVSPGLRNRRSAERDLFLGALSFDLSTGEGLQRALNALGADPRLVEDGLVGPKTRHALATWQARAGLAPSGISSPATLEKLRQALGP